MSITTNTNRKNRIGTGNTYIEILPETNTIRLVVNDVIQQEWS